MTTEAGTPSLNKPVPDRSEYQRRCEEALKVAHRTLDACEKIDPATGSAAIAFAGVLALGQITAILKDR